MKLNRVLPPLPITKRYVLGLFISLKHITANVVDRKTGRVAVSASSVEKSLKDGMDCGRACNVKAAAAVGEVLAVRLKVDGLHREPIYANPSKERRRTASRACLPPERSYRTLGLSGPGGCR